MKHSTNINNYMKTRMPGVQRLAHEARMWFYRMIGRVSPKTLVNIWYNNIYGRNIDLKQPKTIGEKVNWLKFHGDIKLWARCADKYEVREYVREAGLEHTLNHLYGVYDNADDIDFDSLPRQFVIKTTNGGGGNEVMIVTDRDTIDRKAARTTLNKWLRKKVGELYYEPQYKLMKPRLIVEKYLEPDAGEYSLVDIKVNCFNGKAYSILLCSDRQLGKGLSRSVYDLNWNIQPEKITDSHKTDKSYPRPASLDRIIEYSERLSQGIPYVRVDWYEIGSEPIFSEMTFTPAGGYPKNYSPEYLLELGNQLELPL